MKIATAAWRRVASGPFDIYAFRPNKRNAINTRRHETHRWKQIAKRATLLRRCPLAAAEVITKIIRNREIMAGVFCNSQSRRSRGSLVSSSRIWISSTKFADSIAKRIRKLGSTCDPEASRAIVQVGTRTLPIPIMSEDTWKVLILHVSARCAEFSPR